MSRVGKVPIQIPKNVIVKIENNIIEIGGPKGNLKQYINPIITLKQEKDKIYLDNEIKKKNNKSLHGLYRSLINNMIIGVTKGFKKYLEVIGIGYKAESEKNILKLNLGYSHLILFYFPKEIKIKTKSTREKNYIIEIEGIDKQLVGQISAKIKSLKNPEPYKGKGIRFLGEKIRKKSGKSSKK
jgi:large subunit ribosomal protein L6